MNRFCLLLVAPFVLGCCLLPAPKTKVVPSHIYRIGEPVKLDGVTITLKATAVTKVTPRVEGISPTDQFQHVVTTFVFENTSANKILDHVMSGSMAEEQVSGYYAVDALIDEHGNTYDPSEIDDFETQEFVPEGPGKLHPGESCTSSIIFERVADVSQKFRLTLVPNFGDGDLEPIVWDFDRP